MVRWQVCAEEEASAACVVVEVAETAERKDTDDKGNAENKHHLHTHKIYQYFRVLYVKRHNIVQYQNT